MRHRPFRLADRSTHDQVRELEAALRHQREIAETERRRANALEQQVRVAFTVAGWRTRERSTRQS
jgi:hypothetical protein